MPLVESHIINRPLSFIDNIAVRSTENSVIQV